MGKASAQAPSNIALSKYWGRRDDKLTLPNNSSFSMTFDAMYTQTTVDFSDEYEQDEIIINDKSQEGEKKDKALDHLNLIRKIAGIDTPVKMMSVNNFPTAAGLASSAAGFAALTFAASRAAGLKWNDRELSIYSRRSSSGSAARSIHGGFVEWHKGKKPDGTDSYAETFKDEKFWPEFRVIACILTEKEKAVSSAAGMKDTINTCPYYAEWPKTAELDVLAIKQAVLDKDLKRVGEAAENNCLKMHATMIATKPPLLYWEPETLKVMKAIQKWRSEGIPAYFTIDAGPQVKVITSEEHVPELDKRLMDLKVVQRNVITKPGPGARELIEHLF